MIDMKPYQQKKKANEALENWDFILDSKGYPKRNSIINIEVILENDPNIRGKIAYNDFTYDVEVTDKITLSHSIIDKGIAQNDLDPALLAYMEKWYGVLFAPSNLQMAVLNVALRHRYNPVKDYFDRCYNEWDGEKRLNTLFPDYLGAQPGEVTELITKLWMTGVVAKVYDPTVKFDFVLDLVGGQGVGKTTILERLSNGWYTDGITDFKDKDNLSLMLRSLIVNDDELVATSNSKFEEVKKFVTQTYVEYRKPYDKRIERYHKNFVIARTTNELEYLKDKTGERRFLPILANPDRQTKNPVDDLTQDEIDQLWGEAAHLYHHGFELSLTKAQVQMLEEARQDFEYKDDIELAIEHYLQIKLPHNFEFMEDWKRRQYIKDMQDVGSSDIGIGTREREWVSSKDVAWECFGVEIAKDRKLANKIKYLFDTSKEWEKSRVRVKGIATSGFRKKS